MGYHKARQVARLVWPDGHELHGLEIRVKVISVGTYLQYTRIFGDKSAENSDDEVTEIYSDFVDNLISWNLEDEEGKPIPQTLEGLFTQELDFINTIIFAWADSLTKVSEELGKGSPSGDRSVEASLPMETLSPSQ